MSAQTQTASTPAAVRPVAPLNREQVTEICGRMDDLKIATIIGTGATAAELMEARTWAAADDYMGAALHRAANGRVAKLVELLKADEPDWDDR